MVFNTRQLLALSVVAVAACQESSFDSARERPARETSAEQRQSIVAIGDSPAWDKTLATSQGQAVNAGSLYPALIEAAGGEVLVEWVVEHAIAQELARRGIHVKDENVENERLRLLNTLAAEENEAARLLAELRNRRRLGPQRFQTFLKTNAGLRLLIQDQVVVTPGMVRQQHELAYGPLYEARVITVETLADAAKVLSAINEGESFSDLASRLSTDSSRAQGGLLSPMSAADSTYPQAMRTALAMLQPGKVSEPIAVDRSFLILKLERIIERNQAALEDVHSELETQARARLESQLMRQKARELLGRADVVVFDPVLREQWLRRREELTAP